MPIYNGDLYLREAIDSILNQTLQDFELIVIDDDSTDSTASVLKDYCARDPRIKLHQQPNNKGIVEALNLGLRLARGKYIARMDADDISLPQRFQKQVRFMDSHAEIGICGSWIKTIGEQAGDVWRYPESHDAIHASMLFANTLVHSSVMIRIENLRAHNLWYDENAQSYFEEDYDLWSRALPYLQFANLPEILLFYRLHAGNISNKHAEPQQIGRRIVYHRLFDRLHLEYTESELQLHEKISQFQYDYDEEFLQSAHQWFEKIYQANQKTGVIKPEALAAELGKRWTRLSRSVVLSHHRTIWNLLKSIFGYKNEQGVRKITRRLAFLIERGFLKARTWIKKDVFL
jgi:glycosyltransferase involved in cell wall biosynthesis